MQKLQKPMSSKSLRMGNKVQRMQCPYTSTPGRRSLASTAVAGGSLVENGLKLWAVSLLQIVSVPFRAFGELSKQTGPSRIT